MKRNSCPFTVVLLLAISLSVWAESPMPSDPVFKATTTDGKPAGGRIGRLDLGAGILTLDGPAGRELKLSQIVSLTRDGATPPPSLPEGSLVVFPDGDRLRAVIGTTTDTALQVLPGALGDAPTSVPLDSLLGVLLAPPAEADAAEALWNRVRSEPRNAEVLWLANGDRLTGSLLSLSAEKLEFQPDTGPVSVPRASVIALGADPALVKYPKPAGAFLEVTFTDGSRLGLATARLEQGRIVGKTLFGVEIRPELKVISRLHVRSDAVSYLSELKPAAAQYVGYLGRHPETFGRDATWDGHGLRLGGQPFEHGLGTLPRTLLAYRVEPHNTRFQATVGLDDRAGELASVVFRVLVDGQERFVSPAMGRHSEPVPVDIPVQGGKVLILITEFGERGDVQDVADWAEARLVR